MWRWQLKNLLSIHTRFVIRLIGVSCTAHVLIFFCLFCMYRGNNQTLNLTVDLQKSADATIIFLPLHKKIAPAQPHTPKSSPHTSTSSAQRSAAEPTPVQPEQSLALAEKKAEAAHTKFATTLSSAPTKNKKKQGKEKKLVQKSEPAHKKNIPEKRPVSKKVEPSAQKKKIEPAPAPLPQEVRKTPSALEQLNTASEQGTAATAEENVIFVGQEDLAALQAQQAITNDITAHFKPPAGLKKGLSCALTVAIDWDNHVKVTVTQSSGVKLFDIQTRLALQKITVAPWMRGKEILITLKN